jgi:predicted RNase H-like HicB family nuclease
MAETKQITVRAEWDNDAKVWVVEINDVPGLVIEAESSAKLLEKWRVLIPELLKPIIA